MNPVWLYVIAWLLPLCSFVLLVFGGKHWGKTAGYVASAAIIGSCILSLAGFVRYASQAHGLFEGHTEHGAGSGAHEPDATAPPQGPQLVDPESGRAAAALEPAGSHGTSPVVWAWDFPWVAIGAREIRLGFYVDILTVLMFLMVSFIASLIHIFSIGYMHEELHDPVHDPLAVRPGEPPLHRQGRFPRFFTYMSLFCFSMLGLVLADNGFMVFIFWELVGLCSYLLIGFYYERRSASTAANKAFITNRIGDAGMIVGLTIIWTSLGTFNIQDVVHTMRDPAGRIVRIDARNGEPLYWQPKRNAWLAEPPQLAAAADAAEPGEVQLFDPHSGAALTRSMGYLLLTVAGVGIFIGCVGKSAQFPLQVWLPDAMEGPTPVSALIHAATMVAAGVYLVGRFYALFTPEALLIIAYTGGITLFMAGTIALVMTDIKRVLAYSTVSQLGYMMLGLGVGGWAAGLFHLLTHAFFKALLFLGSGSVIHGTGTQEMPQMGALFRKMPITAITMLIGVLAISGILGFSGYYSKDAIVAQAMQFGCMENPQHILLFLLPTAGAGITAFYMFRLFFLTFTGEPRDHHVHDHAHESTATMWVPLAILAVPSIAVGYSFGGPSPLLERLLGYGAPDVALSHPPEAIHQQAGWVASGVVLAGILMSALFYLFRVLSPAELPRQFPVLYRFLWNKWYFDELYRAVFVQPLLGIAQSCRGFDWNVLDGIIDGAARWTVRVSSLDGRFDFRIIDGIANWVADWVFATGFWLRRLQTGRLRQYVMFLAIAAVGVFAVIFYLAPHFGTDLLENR